MNFIKTYFASLLAVFTGLLILILFSISLIGSFSKKEEISVADKSILHLKLNDQIVENASTEEFDIDLSQFSPLPIDATTGKMGLYQIIANINRAKEDSRIAGIYLNTGLFVQAGWANLKSIRDALIDFKTSEKFIYAYSETYGEKAYYLASVADKIFMPAIGGMEFNGLASSPMFYTGLFEKLEIQPKIFKVGTFKSAVEPYMLKKMSEANRLQTEKYLGDIWDVFRREVATSRKITPDDIDRLAAELILADGIEAQKAGLTDEVAYEEEVFNQMKEASGRDEDEKIRLISLKKYMKAPAGNAKFSKNKIAVVFAEGVIGFGKSSDGNMGSETIVKELKKAREDKQVKAIVLRVNSPGGNIIASDLIAAEVQLCKNQKPIIVSMADVAASGGYYISAHADRIFAQENTITGSIGIFGILYDGNQFLNSKLGITVDEVETHPQANIGDPTLPWSPADEAVIQNSVKKGYGTFINLVREGREFQDSLSVDKIAQGRVWSGKDALELKLVDEIGDLKAAIAHAAEKAGVTDDYRIERLPRAVNPLQELLGTMTGEVSIKIENNIPLQEELKLLQKIKSMIPKSGVYALMPYSVEIR